MVSSPSQYVYVLKHLDWFSLSRDLPKNCTQGERLSTNAPWLQICPNQQVELSNPFRSPPEIIHFHKGFSMKSSIFLRFSQKKHHPLGVAPHDLGTFHLGSSLGLRCFAEGDVRGASAADHCELFLRGGKLWAGGSMASLGGTMGLPPLFQGGNPVWKKKEQGWNAGFDYLLWKLIICQVPGGSTCVLRQSHGDLRTWNDFDGNHLVRFMDVCWLGWGPIERHQEELGNRSKKIRWWVNKTLRDLKNRYQPVYGM